MDNCDVFMRFSRVSEVNLKKLSDEEQKLAAKTQILQEEVDKQYNDLVTALEN